MREQEQKVVFKTPPKVTFIMGILAGITVTSLAAFIMSFSLLNAEQNETSPNGSGKVAGEEVTVDTNTVAPTAPTAPTAEPTPAEYAASLTKQDIEVKSDEYVRGNASAPVAIIEYSDFECPFCSRVQPTIEQLLDEYEGQVKLVFRHFPLSFHASAQKAAEASECAGVQGKFWEMHDKMFDNQQSLSVDSLKGYAKDLGLNTSKFNSCLDDGTYAQKVKDDMSEGSQLGVSGTPGTFVDGMLVSGARPYAYFQAVVDLALTK